MIKGSLDKAKEVKGLPEVIEVLNMPGYAGLAEAINKGIEDLDKRVAADNYSDTLPGKSLPELREDKTCADALRGAADRAQKVADVEKAIEPFSKTIDEIIKNTTKAGRDAASVGDGSSEAAAIEESKTGQQTKGCWHGPRCAEHAKGLANAIKSLEDHKKRATEAATKAKIDGIIKLATDRKTGLETGASAWATSKYKDKAK